MSLGKRGHGAPRGKGQGPLRQQTRGVHHHVRRLIQNQTSSSGDYPACDIAGAGFAIRLRDQSVGFTMITTYMPPLSDEPAKKRRALEKGSNQFLQWAIKELGAVPTRSNPILWVDVNAPMGRGRGLPTVAPNIAVRLVGGGAVPCGPT
eukprot:6066243-Pyramimonas_sp.AAC.1